MYVKFDENGLVSEIIPDTDAAFPNVPIDERYPAEFVAGLHYCDNDAAVEIGMKYDAETDSFDYPPLPPAIDLGVEAEEIIDGTGNISQAEINLDFEYRLSCIELGIN